MRAGRARAASPDMPSGTTGRQPAAAPQAACCGPACETGGRSDARKASAVEPQTKELVLRRLRRIEGQVRGLQRMVEEERYCADVMTQILAVQESLRAASGELLRNHLRHCVAGALRSGDPADAERVVAELAGLFERAGRQ